MTKTKKIALFSGLAVLLIAVVIVLVVMLTRDDYLDDPKKNLIGFNGNVVEITSDDSVVIEVTKEKTSELKLGEKVTVKYDSVKAEIIENENAEPKDVTEDFEIQVGDEVFLSYLNGTLEKNGDDYKINKGALEFYFSDLENRTFA